MKRIAVHADFDEYDSIDELGADDRRLLEEAARSALHAYAPYSRFYVGAAVLLDNGKIICGNNQENASYPLGLCAERVAVFSAGAGYPGIKIKAIAITARSNEIAIDRPVAPCGACRQVIAEYEHRDRQPIRIILSGENGKVIVGESIAAFLPFMFDADSLKPKKS